MILGAVLAGGQSRRFGSDKALAVWNGTTLIDHVRASLEGVAAAVVVCGRIASDFVSIPDRPYANLGPLGGINAALHHAKTLGYTRVITVPCDAPSIAPALLAALAIVTGDSFLADMPVIGSWQSRHAEALEAYLETAASRSVRGWAASIDAVSLDHAAPVNINRPDDLQRLEGG